MLEYSHAKQNLTPHSRIHLYFYFILLFNGDACPGNSFHSGANDGANGCTVTDRNTDTDSDNRPCEGARAIYIEYIHRL